MNSLSGSQKGGGRKKKFSEEKAYQERSLFETNAPWADDLFHTKGEKKLKN